MTATRQGKPEKQKQEATKKKKPDSQFRILKALKNKPEQATAPSLPKHTIIAPASGPRKMLRAHVERDIEASKRKEFIMTEVASGYTVRRPGNLRVKGHVHSNATIVVANGNIIIDGSIGDNVTIHAMQTTAPTHIDEFKINGTPLAINSGKYMFVVNGRVGDHFAFKGDNANYDVIFLSPIGSNAHVKINLGTIHASASNDHCDFRLLRGEIKVALPGRYNTLAVTDHGSVETVRLANDDIISVGHDDNANLNSHIHVGRSTQSLQTAQMLFGKSTDVTLGNIDLRQLLSPPQPLSRK